MKQNIGRIIGTILMWIIWFIIVEGIVILLTFAYASKPDSNKWMLELPWLVTLSLFLVISIGIMRWSPKTEP